MISDESIFKEVNGVELARVRKNQLNVTLEWQKNTYICIGMLSEHKWYVKAKYGKTKLCNYEERKTDVPV